MNLQNPATLKEPPGFAMENFRKGNFALPSGKGTGGSISIWGHRKSMELPEKREVRFFQKERGDKVHIHTRL